MGLFSARLHSKTAQLETSALASKKTLQQCPTQLLQHFSIDWPEVQRRIDQKLDANYRSKMSGSINTVLEQTLSEMLKPDSIVLSYNPRFKSMDIHVDAHHLAQKFSCRIWNVERNPFCYRNSLTRANTLGDRRVRFSWSPSVENALDFWLAKRTNSDDKPIFDSLIATELLAEVESTTDCKQTVKKIKEVLNDGATLLSLECFRRGSVPDDDDSSQRLQNATNVLQPFFHVESIQRLEIPSFDELNDEHFEWVLIVARRISQPTPQKAKNLPTENALFRRINGGF